MFTLEGHEENGDGPTWVLENAAPTQAAVPAEARTQFFGDCWEWTSSAYQAYPGYTAPAALAGEGLASFSSGQMVLRGGSCVTPAALVRASYRNFLAPETRCQFSGIRLAK